MLLYATTKAKKYGGVYHYIIVFRLILVLFKLKEKLMNMVRWLTTEKSVDKFLFGSKSNFDDFCQEVVKELREEYPHIKRVYVRMYYPEL